MMDKNRIAGAGGVGQKGVMIRKCLMAGAAAGLFFAGAPARSADVALALGGGDCPVNYWGEKGLRKALQIAAGADSTGLDNNYWAVVVNRGGVVCAVAYSGGSVGAQWLSSRQIAAAKAFTANGLSLNSKPLSTAQLYQWVQPSNRNIGNPLFGLEGGNVLNSFSAYQGDYSTFGTPSDPMVGKRVGGQISFGGGLGLYRGTTLVGGIGVSGDTACADHSVAWRIRDDLKMKPTAGDDKLPFATNTDQTNGHPHCPNDGGTQGAK
jgi:uncharacterized protein GlcG (DUF336 family)